MAGKFELFQDADGMHRFRLKASNGAILVTSDAQEFKEQCIKDVESIRKTAPYAQVEDHDHPA